MMEQWTISEPHTDRFRLSIDFGGRPYWCMFDYIVAPVPACEGIEIVIRADPNADTEQWFPDLKRGMEMGWASLREESGQLLTGVRITVTKIHTHPVDTTARGCERYGWAFIVELVRSRAVQVTGK